MRKLQVAIFFTIFLMAISASGLMAQQGRQYRTSSAKAAYGYPTEKYVTKKKSKKSKKRSTKKKKQRKSPKKNAAPLYRKKDPWVN